MLIQWSDEDQTYVVSLPEWGDLVHTRGDTYKKAFKSAMDVLELLIEGAQADGKQPPAPHLFT